MYKFFNNVNYLQLGGFAVADSLAKQASPLSSLNCFGSLDDIRVPLLFLFLVADSFCVPLRARIGGRSNKPNHMYSGLMKALARTHH